MISRVFYEHNARWSWLPPREDLARQDLVYAAAAEGARAAEKQAAELGCTSMKAVFERAAKEQAALAAKFDRIATGMR
jgi:hypothetical protein